MYYKKCAHLFVLKSWSLISTKLVNSLKWYIDPDLLLRPETLTFFRYHKHLRFGCISVSAFFCSLSCRLKLRYTYGREILYIKQKSFLLIAKNLKQCRGQINNKINVKWVHVVVETMQTSNILTALAVLSMIILTLLMFWLFLTGN